MIRKLVVVSVAGALVLALGSTSGAKTAGFKQGTYKGKTSQGKPVTFTVTHQANCPTGKVVNGANQFKAGLCLTPYGETPKIYAHCSHGAPDQFGDVNGPILIPKSGTVNRTYTISNSDLRLSVTLTKNGHAHGTGHYHEEYSMEPSPGADPVAVVCDSGSVTFSAKRVGK